jgi:hypothetical protein
MAATRQLRLSTDLPIETAAGVIAGVQRGLPATRVLRDFPAAERAHILGLISRLDRERLAFKRHAHALVLESMTSGGEGRFEFGPIKSDPSEPMVPNASDTHGSPDESSARPCKRLAGPRSLGPSAALEEACALLDLPVDAPLEPSTTVDALLERAPHSSSAAAAPVNVIETGLRSPVPHQRRSHLTSPAAAHTPARLDEAIDGACGSKATQERTKTTPRVVRPQTRRKRSL